MLNNGNHFSAQGARPTAVFRIKGLQAGRRVLSPGNGATRSCAESLARIRISQRRWSEAEALLRESLNTPDPETPYAWQMSMRRSELGLALLEQARYDEAEPLLLAGYQGMVERRAVLTDAGLIGSAGGWIARLYSARGKPDQAAQWSARVQADLASAGVVK